ncbi:MAG: helix-turn-helix transcriptional regulator [Rhizobiales bacterium]|nr:helix-turn-helix transcriptional regulator [Hyphomicrobiales bacterium]
MPWEKAFDLNEATDRAIEVFWKKGYEATSMADLVKCMAINKGSLYNAFSSKQVLFTRALMRYETEYCTKALAALSDIEDPVQALTALFDDIVAETRKDPDCKGCLLVNTALDLPNQSEETKTLVTNSFDTFRVFFKTMSESGQARGQIPLSVSPEDASKSLLAFLIGMRVLARGSFDTICLDTLKREALRLAGIQAA